MQILPSLRPGAASSPPTPVEIWQTLLSHLLQQHYGLTLSDTPFGNDGVIEQHIDAGISLCDALNFIVEKYDLVRTDRPGFSITEQSPLITRIDILRARKACGLMTRNSYRAVTDITTGRYHQELKP
ncbi:toxin CbtA [Salmonella enterica subsp. enterica serovar Newport]|nr:toxin CbtA [Salmonella enterica subsp. enterica serovar Newport]EHJ5407709.1 toxin CbtA [Salmonella enterica subsp. enterica serovar Wedding]EJA5030773.1 toxin CbtA [Salmonella enterica]EJA5054836.1 toxin CbtA [Salmonella enterica]EJA5151654.1 toxin CbtA [Salmonella enterica]